MGDELGVLAVRSPPHPFQPLSWVAEGQPRCPLPGAGEDELQTSAGAPSESSMSGLHRTRDWRRGQREGSGSEQHRVCSLGEVWGTEKDPCELVGVRHPTGLQRLTGTLRRDRHRHTGAHKDVGCARLLLAHTSSPQMCAGTRPSLLFESLARLLAA